MNYDLMLKFEGLKALCGGGMSDEHISSLLFPTHADQERRSRLSRIKSGDLPLLGEHKDLLTQDFNLRINKYLRGVNSPSTQGVLRSEDWDRPVRDLFADLASHQAGLPADALDRAHAGLLGALSVIDEYRERNDALLVERHFGQEAERTRMPESAEPVDPLDLPLVHLRVGQRMTIVLRGEVTTTPVRAWLFYLRNPDQRVGVGLADRLWDQKANEMVFWHAGSPFELPARYVGDFPGFPANVRNLTGEITVFLLLEPMHSKAVADLLGKPDEGWTPDRPPSFEGLAHLVTCRMRLFQRGNTKKLGSKPGDLSYGPPKLFVRKYRVAT
jgi:hypothetical protein